MLENFDMEIIGTVGDEKEMQSKSKGIAFICRHHKIDMSKEDAESRGILDKWSGGSVPKRVFAEVLWRPEKLSVPRAGKRPAMVKTNDAIIVCPECTRSERFFMIGPETTPLFSHLVRKK